MFTSNSFKIAGILMVIAFVVALATRPFVAAVAYLRNAFNWYAKYRKPSMASIHANMPAANAAGMVYQMRVQDAARARKETQLMWAYGIATVAFMLTLFVVSMLSTFPTTQAKAAGLDMSYSFTHSPRFVHSNPWKGCKHIGMNWSSPTHQPDGKLTNPHPGCVPAAPAKAIVVRQHDGDGSPVVVVTPPVTGCTIDCGGDEPPVVPPVVVPPVVVTHGHPNCNNGAGNGDNCTPGHSSGSNQGNGQQTGDQTNQGEQGNGHTNGNNDHGKGHGKGK